MSNAGTGTPILVVLIGPPAVGKMTVGQELEHLTGFPLFHVHQVIDLALRYFPYSTTPRSPYRRLVEGYRALFFAEAACAGLSVITTAGWRFDLPTDTEAMHGYAPPFLARGGRVYVAELLAALETRLARNRTENRRRHKRTDWATDDVLRQDDAHHRYDSGGTLPLDLPLLHLETDHLTARETAERIRAHFALPLAAR